MAQFVRRPETLGAMKQEPMRDKSRAGYFGNVKSRLGPKLPPGVAQPPQFAKRPWETQPQARMMQESTASRERQHQPIVGRPLNHIPHIRNPKLRQYYLQGTSWDLNNTAVMQEHADKLSDDSLSSRGLIKREQSSEMNRGSELSPSPTDAMGKQHLLQSLFNKYSRRNVHSQVYSEGLHGNTVFSISSQCDSKGAPSAENNLMGHCHSQTANLSTALNTTELLVQKERTSTTSQGSTQAELNPDSDLKAEPEAETDGDCLDKTPAPPHSPSPEAEYDKLLDVEAVPLPDGQLCLLALPSECCQGEGPEAMPYLKLFCRYITDRKGVVSGILLVTSNKIFFDPCKTLALVKEHGCEEYLLSCSVDSLASVSFFSDISHVHFTTSQQRRKGKFFQKLKPTKCQAGILPNHKGESVPALVSVASLDLSSLALSLTKEACGDEEGESRDMAEAERELDGSPLELLSQASVGGLGASVLSSAATFCCGGQEAASKAKSELLPAADNDKSNVQSQTTGPHRSFGGNPGSLMFVRLRLQPSAGKKQGLHLGSAKSSTRRDAWLALSQDSSEKLFAYLTHCRPGLCTLEGDAEEGDVDRDEEEFVLIEDKGEEEEEEEEEVFRRHHSTMDDWEMVLMENSGDKVSLVIDSNPEGLGGIVEASHILVESHVRELSKELPPRTVSRTWQLAYSTSRHGASLKSLYRKLSATDSPVLIVIKDELDEIFGAFLSHPLRPSDTFYGTGETFLFMLQPRFKCFRWTGENSFFIKGDMDSFAIGGGSGHFGLWLDESLYLGRSSPCYTFNNCCLSETADFRVMELEVWTFN